MEFGKKLQELRKKREMTQEKLAYELGISIPAISKWENGNALPDILMLCSIAGFFAVTTDELLGRNGAAEFVVVDDARLIRETIAGIIREMGGKCTAMAENAQQLMAALAEKQPAGVFLDIGLPDRSGLSVLKELKEKHSSIKVVIVTADHSQATQTQALASGAEGYITKPFLPDHIRWALRDLFSL